MALLLFIMIGILCAEKSLCYFKLNTKFRQAADVQKKITLLVLRHRANGLFLEYMKHYLKAPPSERSLLKLTLRIFYT